MSVAKFSVSHMDRLTELYLEGRDFEDRVVNKIIAEWLYVYVGKSPN